MAANTCLSLYNGEKMPVLGLGTWKSPPAEIRKAVETAIDNGYRHIDCAYLYKNEGPIGDAIQTKIEEGVVQRKDLFITSKVWLTHFRKVEECFTESLKALKLDYLDLYLVHLPMGFQFVSKGDMFPTDENGDCKYDEGIHYTDVYKDVEKLKKKGLVKSIGVSNFNIYQLNKLLSTCEIKPAVHQYEIHPYLDQEELLRYSLSNGLAVTGYSPFGSPDRPWAAAKDPPSLLTRSDLVKMASNYRKSVAQLILKYLIQRGVSVIPKSVTPERIKSNADIFDFQVADDDMTAIKKLDCNWRVLNLPSFQNHKYFPFRENYSE